jgi:hypothetical protein
MEEYPMLMDQQNQHCENVYTSESNLYSQCNSSQNYNNILHRDRKINPKVPMEAPKTSNSQSSPEQKRAMLAVSQYLTSNYNTEP